jgi:hypothetical protein
LHPKRPSTPAPLFPLRVPLTGTRADLKEELTDQDHYTHPHARTHTHTHTCTHTHADLKEKLTDQDQAVPREILAHPASREKPGI